MHQSDEQKFRKILKSIAGRIQPEADAITEEARSGSGGLAVNELSNTPFHNADMGTEEYLHDLNTMMAENEDYILGEVQAALERIDAGTFGICENCGKAIGRTRLEAIPYTRYCIDCATKLDLVPQVNLNEGRPKTMRSSKVTDVETAAEAEASSQ